MFLSIFVNFGRKKVYFIFRCVFRSLRNNQNVFNAIDTNQIKCLCPEWKSNNNEMALSSFFGHNFTPKCTFCICVLWILFFFLLDWLFLFLTFPLLFILVCRIMKADNVEQKKIKKQAKLLLLLLSFHSTKLLLLLLLLLLLHLFSTFFLLVSIAF